MSDDLYGDRKGDASEGGKGPRSRNAQKAHALRSALLSAVTPDDMTQMVEAIMKRVKAKGDAIAFNILLERVIGSGKRAAVRLGLGFTNASTPEAVNAAAKKTVEAVANADITIEQGEALLKLFKAAGDIAVVEQLEVRIKELEAAQQGGNSGEDW